MKTMFYNGLALVVVCAITLAAGGCSTGGDHSAATPQPLSTNEQQRKLFAEARYIVLIEAALAEHTIKANPENQRELIKLLDSEFVASREQAAAVLGIFFMSDSDTVSDALKASLSKEADIDAMVLEIVALRRLSDSNMSYVGEFLDKLKASDSAKYRSLIAILPPNSTPKSHLADGR